jgi:hypothetical protein
VVEALGYKPEGRGLRPDVVTEFFLICIILAAALRRGVRSV